MNGNSAGLVTDVARSAGDHSERSRHRAAHCLKTALQILEACSRQEVQQACFILEEALLHVESLAPREGIEGGNRVGQEDGKAAA